jgi:hypothetical protein
LPFSLSLKFRERRTRRITLSIGLVNSRKFFLSQDVGDSSVVGNGLGENEGDGKGVDVLVGLGVDDGVKVNVGVLLGETVMVGVDVMVAVSVMVEVSVGVVVGGMKRVGVSVVVGVIVEEAVGVRVGWTDPVAKGISEVAVGVGVSLAGALRIATIPAQ